VRSAAETTEAKKLRQARRRGLMGWGWLDHEEFGANGERLLSAPTVRGTARQAAWLSPD
jgi:hypothetical protein